MGNTPLYTNEMLAEMVESLTDTVQELINVKNTVAQGISVLNIKGGTDKEIVVNATDISNSVNAYTDLCTIKSMAAGTVRFSGTFRASGGRASYSYSGYLGYSLDGTNWVLIKSLGQSGTFDLTGAFSVDIPIKANDVLHIGAYCSLSPYVNCILVAGSKLGYNQIDIVNEGAFVRAT